MDADGWDAATDPRAMIWAGMGRVTARKWRLAGVVASRAARQHHLIPTVADVLSLAERYADGLVDAAELGHARAALRRDWDDTELPTLLIPGLDDRQASRLAEGVFCDRLPRDFRRLPGFGVGWLREVVGNPFRWVRWEDEWLTRTVHAVAAPAYAEGRFDTLPVLADALEDAGCDNDMLLAHLRVPGPHCRGCWALDVVLGKT